MTFIETIQQEVSIALKNLEEIPVLDPTQSPKVSVIELLKMALKNELEASQLAALWLPSTPEIDVKLGLARQCGDEAKHYKLIEKRLLDLSVPLDNFSPLSTGYSPLYQWLTTLETTIERIAAGPFAREAIAIKRNAQLIAVLEAMGDKISANLYREQIQPDEEWHHNFGLSILRKYATSQELEEKALSAIKRTLELAEELRTIAMAKSGACVIPGC